MGHDVLHQASHVTGNDQIPAAGTGGNPGLMTDADKTILDALNAIADIQEYHTVSAGEVTAGFFTLAQTPVDIEGVQVHVIGGVLQVNKQGTNIGAITPDFDVLNSNELHFNNNGAATGLSGDIIANDVLAIIYRYSA